MNADASGAKAQVIVGAVLTAAPWWASAIETTTKFGAMVAAICGAVVGIHGVIKILRSRKR